MSKEQLQTLLDQLKVDGELQVKLQGAVNLDAAVAIANSMGFDVSKADWLENKRLIGPHLLWEWDWI
jgi:predicted ribosomally synthesized peptide with nif11-like leader